MARTDIDRFIRQKLDASGLEPMEPANKRELLRRVTYDLIGLPPTPEQSEAFVADDSAAAYEKVIDRLLASPHYGERWGRRWLDVVRYGEDDTRGLAKDGSGIERYASAYVYRDWVIEAFNEDMPYDRFVRAQFAGDLMGKELREKTIGGWAFSATAPGITTSRSPLSRAPTSGTTASTSPVAAF